MWVWFDVVLIAVGISLVPSIAVAALKGRYNLLLAGIMGIFPLLWVAAFKIAAPDSWWAKRFYRGVKLERAESYQAYWNARW